MRFRLLAALAGAMLIPAVARAQFVSFGAGAGTALGPRADAGGNHVNLSLMVKPPLLPGIRADGYLMLATDTDGTHGAVVVSAVMSAPIPIVTPYLIAGIGRYGVANRPAETGANIGIGASVGLGVGPSLFAEARRHFVWGSNLITVGIRF